MGEQRYIGPNLIIVERDLVIVDKQTEWTEVWIAEMLALFTEVQRKEGRVFIISIPDMSLRPSPGVRRSVAQWFDEHEVAAVAVVSSSTASRAVVALVIGAMNLVKRRQLNLRSCATLDEARAFINEERARRYGT